VNCLKRRNWFRSAVKIRWQSALRRGARPPFFTEYAAYLEVSVYTTLAGAQGRQCDSYMTERQVIHLVSITRARPSHWPLATDY